MNRAPLTVIGPLFAAAVALLLAVSPLTSCDEGFFNEADQVGVGAECATIDDCGLGQICLTNFRGGYCGQVGCAVDFDCPAGAGCVAHTDGNQYCFLVCDLKSECNNNRSVINEANCSSSITWVEKDNGKACVPPAG